MGPHVGLMFAGCLPIKLAKHWNGHKKMHCTILYVAPSINFSYTVYSAILLCHSNKYRTHVNDLVPDLYSTNNTTCELFCTTAMLMSSWYAYFRLG